MMFLEIGRPSPVPARRVVKYGSKMCGMLNATRPTYFVVDTGGEVISISAATAGHFNQGNYRKIPLKVYGTSGWDRDAFLLPGMRSTLDADLQAALDSLPEAFREAVWLRDVEEFSYAEIAEMLNVPIGTVMSRISRGRRMLFEKLSPAAPVPAEAAGGRR